MKSLVIYLKEIEQSKKLADRCISSCNQFQIQASLFEGSTPSQAKEWINKNNLKIYNPGPKIYKIKMNKPGVQGCLLSHYRCWQYCVELNQNIMILEHDAVVVSDHYQQNFIDVLQLDEHRLKDDPAEKNEVVANTFERKGVKMMNGAHGYCVTPQGATKLINGIHTHGMSPADWHISELLVDIKVVRPRVVKVENDISLTNDRDFYI